MPIRVPLTTPDCQAFPDSAGGRRVAPMQIPRFLQNGVLAANHKTTN